MANIWAFDSYVLKKNSLKDPKLTFKSYIFLFSIHFKR